MSIVDFVSSRYGVGFPDLEVYLRNKSSNIRNTNDFVKSVLTFLVMNDPDITPLSSTNYGICLEYLGKLKDKKIQGYLSDRNGCWNIIVDETSVPSVPKTITFRKVINELSEVFPN